MLTNTAATLYNEYVNPDTKRKEWRRTELDAVHWENNKATNVIASGLESADSTFLMIWFSVQASDGRTYLPPKQYAALSAAEVDRHWTLWPMHDRMIKGIVPGPAVVETLADMDKAYDDLITVKSVDTMDYGSPSMKHWEVSGA